MNYTNSDERRHRPTVRYYEYFYSPMKAAHNAHTHIKVYKIDRGQNYTENTTYN